MARVPTGLRPYEIFSAYRFAVKIPETQEILGVQSIFNDPFTNAVWIGRAHVADRGTLIARLVETKQIEVWLLPRVHRTARKITVNFESARWLPLDLGSCREEVAMEWVALDLGVYSCGPVQDIEYEDLPPDIKDLIHPNRMDEDMV